MRKNLGKNEGIHEVSEKKGEGSIRSGKKIERAEKKKK